MASDSLPLEHRSAAGEHARCWYPLDNIAKIFPATISARYTTEFRLSAVLDRPVRVAALQRASDQAFERLPGFCVQLRRGVFWHYLEEIAPPRVLADTGSPCMHRPRMRGYDPLVRVLARGSRIAVEYSHVLTDGTGAMAFFRLLLLAYHEECFGVSGEVRDAARAMEIPVPGDSVKPEEFEYASRRIYQRQLPHPAAFKPAWHLPGARLPVGAYRVTTMRYPLPALKERAGAMGVSVTDLCIAAFCAALQDRYFAQRPPRRKRRPIRIMVPVNLRPATGAITYRNFFVYTMVEIDQRVGRYELDEIARKVHHQLRAELDPRSLQRQITRNVSAERNWGIRVLPIVFKDMILRTVHRIDGEAANTASVSNMGVVALPEALAATVRAVDFLPPPSPVTGVNMTVISHGEMVSVSFGSMRADQEIERRVISVLGEIGIQGELRTNWGTTDEFL